MNALHAETASRIVEVVECLAVVHDVADVCIVYFARFQDNVSVQQLDTRCGGWVCLLRVVVIGTDSRLSWFKAEHTFQAPATHPWTYPQAHETSEMVTDCPRHS